MRLPNASFWPSGELRSIYLHWTGGGYRSISSAYHFCIALGTSGAPEIVATYDLRANMRDVRTGGAYAAHTSDRNSYAAGIAICAMARATPHDFGEMPLRDDLVESACALAATVAVRYRIPLRAVRTHAEAALEDGYFGCADGERWDIARLAPALGELTPAEATATADLLRSRVALLNSNGL